MTVYVSSAELIKVTSKLRQSGFLSDAKLVLNDGTTFDVHKILLAAGSSFFELLFTLNPNLHEYQIQIVSRESMDQILNWMYKHTMKLTIENVPQIMKDAHYLDCYEAVAECTKFMMNEIHPDNVIGVWNYSRVYNILNLQEKCFKYLVYNFAKIVDNQEFADLAGDELEIIIKSDDLNADEKVVLESAIVWVERNKKERLSFLPRLLKHMRLATIGEGYFEVHVMERKTVEDACDCNPALEDFIGEVHTFYDDFPYRGTPPYAVPRLSQDLVLSIGGWSGGNACNVIENYDIRADRWAILDLHDPLGERGYLGAAAIGTKLYLVGGTNGERHFNGTSCYDVVTKQFRVLGPMNSARCYISLVSLHGQLYAIGGFDGSRRLRTMERYDPKGNQWSQMAKMKTVRSDAGCAVLDGKIYVVGGFDGQTQLDSVECYNPKVNKWTALPKLSSKRSGVSCVAFEGELYAIGGFDGNRRLKSCEKFNFKQKKWIAVSDMITPRSNFSAALVDGKIMVFGGFNGFSTTEIVERFETWKNGWVRVCDMEMDRSALSICVVSGQALSRDVLKAYSYPNRNKLPEEVTRRMLYEQVSSMSDEETTTFSSESGIINDDEIDVGHEFGVDFSDEDYSNESNEISFSSRSDDDLVFSDGDFQDEMTNDEDSSSNDDAGDNQIKNCNCVLLTLTYE